jgi:hypothetical protein
LHERDRIGLKRDRAPLLSLGRVFFANQNRFDERCSSDRMTSRRAGVMPASIARNNRQCMVSPVGERLRVLFNRFTPSLGPTSGESDETIERFSWRIDSIDAWRYISQCRFANRIGALSI